jgi:hypothetical protein
VCYRHCERAFFANKCLWFSAFSTIKALGFQLSKLLREQFEVWHANDVLQTQEFDQGPAQALVVVAQERSTRHCIIRRKKLFARISVKFVD